ncbi:MAG: hypothetical protein OXC68_06845, partial [Aestuariivita sp.]|nr:hypothetical protein [Aestuariivita sp.]
MITAAPSNITVFSAWDPPVCLGIESDKASLSAFDFTTSNAALFMQVARMAYAVLSNTIFN